MYRRLPPLAAPWLPPPAQEAADLSPAAPRPQPLRAGVSVQTAVVATAECATQTERMLRIADFVPPPPPRPPRVPPPPPPPPPPKPWREREAAIPARVMDFGLWRDIKPTGAVLPTAPRAGALVLHSALDAGKPPTLPPCPTFAGTHMPSLAQSTLLVCAGRRDGEMCSEEDDSAPSGALPL